MNETQISQIDALKVRLLNEYTMNGDTDEYKKIMKRVVEIGARMIHSTLTDISDVPNIKLGFEKMLEKLESFEIMIKSLETKVDNITHNSMQPNCILMVEKIVKETMDAKSKDNKQSISFAVEIAKFVLYVAPVMGAIIWASLHASGAL